MRRHDGEDGGDVEAGSSSPIGRHDDSGPEKGILGGVGLDAIEGQLGADEEDEEGGGGVQRLYLERLPNLCLLHIR